MNKKEIKEVEKAWALIQKYNDDVETKHFKFVRKEGVKYILCEHLKNKTHTVEVQNIWLGDNLRVIACSVCANVHLGTFLRTLGISELVDDPQESDKVEMDENWKDKLRNFWNLHLGAARNIGK